MGSSRRAGAVITGLVSASLFAGCGGGERRADTRSGAMDTSSSSTMSARTDTADAGMNGAAGQLSDANIMALLDEANMADSASGAYTVTKATNPDVKAFARLMMAEHHALRAATKGAAFDRTYIEQEIGTHKAVLDLAGKAHDAAQNPELKQLIEKAKPVIE